MEKTIRLIKNKSESERSSEENRVEKKEIKKRIKKLGIKVRIGKERKEREREG